MSEKIRLVWEDIIDEENGRIYKNITKRAKVPGGWIILTSRCNVSMTFVPDPNHEWK